MRCTASVRHEVIGSTSDETSRRLPPEKPSIVSGPGGRQCQRRRRQHVGRRAELKYQPIGYRWAQNLARYKAAEPQAFARYFTAMAPAASVVTASDSRVVRQ
jgi:hypothetical protein